MYASVVSHPTLRKGILGSYYFVQLSATNDTQRPDANEHSVFGFDSRSCVCRFIRQNSNRSFVVVDQHRLLPSPLLIYLSVSSDLVCGFLSLRYGFLFLLGFIVRIFTQQRLTRLAFSTRINFY
ncbi:hypothetical protein RSOLAG1IB_07319 [Rhizoctonia solani AG-1 IB]|uniref:Uncharacterized protein n=1 Tax=Thanatephorus cucumeris (strain AG1-IB / isolate 7/3/14) TaxID=1108050 RepID=A0A0B7FB65_THACB|nr:hypothetical protein RSOLAG1IB_07319 [Rhizoctonia solani AG-1 IB]